jgi:hypothetical protein
VRTDSVFTHRLFRDLDSGPVGCAWPERARGASEPSHTMPGNRALQHGELVSEQGDLGEQRPARAKRVRQGGGGHQDGFENQQQRSRRRPRLLADRASSHDGRQRAVIPSWSLERTPDPVARNVPRFQLQSAAIEIWNTTGSGHRSARQLFSANDRVVGAFNGEAKELVEMLVGLASRVGWKGTARATREGDDYVIAMRVRRRPVELSERELKRRARSERG